MRIVRPFLPLYLLILASSGPTADQRRQLDWAFDDAARAVDALNRLLQTDTTPAPLTMPAKLTKVP